MVYMGSRIDRGCRVPGRYFEVDVMVGSTQVERCIYDGIYQV